MSGDCDDMAVMLGSLLRSIGVDVAFKFGGEQEGDLCNWHHVWVQALSSGGWVDLDITRPESDIGWSWPNFGCVQVVEIP